MDAVTEPAAQTAHGRLVIGPTVAEAVRVVWRRGWVYAVLVAIYSVALELANVLLAVILPLLTPGMPPIAALGLQRLIHLGLSEVYLISCGTALFITVQRAAVLGEPPSIAAGLRIRRQDFAAWRAVALYWLAAHLVPTLLSHLNGFAAAARLAWYPRYSVPWDMPIYWAFVCLVAPWMALGLPIALFEGDRRAFRTARQRLRRHWPRYLMLLIICLLPGLLCVYLRETLEATLAGLWMLRSPFLRYLAFEGLKTAYAVETYVVVLLMSAAVAAAYLRLSPRFETVYRVFD